MSLPTFIYTLLCLFYFLLAVLFLLPKYRKFSTIFFILSLFIIPSSPFLIQYFFKYQVYAWYFFIIGPLLHYTLLTFGKNQIDKVAVKLLLYLFSFTIAFLVYGILIEPKNIIYILIDLKIVFLFIFGVAFFKSSSYYLVDFFKKRAWQKALLLNLVLDSLFFLLNYKLNIAYIITSDPHYLNDTARYTDFSIPFLVVYIIYKFLYRKSYTLLEFIAVFVPIILSGNRTLFVAISVLGIFYLFRLDTLRFIKYSSLFILIFGALVFYSLRANETSVLNRISVLFDLELIQKNISTRFQPLEYEIKDWSETEYWIFGKGLGKSVYIPWFEYRENISNNNAYLDNIYLTLYIKFGLMSIFIYVFLFNYFRYLTKNTTYTLIFVIYLAIMGLTTAFIYQGTFFVYLITPALVRRLSPERI